MLAAGRGGRLGFAAGDIIRGVNGSAIRNVCNLNRAPGVAQRHWDLVVDRGGQRLLR